MKPKKLIPSVAIILQSQGDVFFIKRQNFLRAFPGYGSFPGGKVDKTESDRPYDIPFLCDHSPKLMRALCRELDEELGIQIEEMIKSGDIFDMKLIGVADTPEFNPVRFSTHFFWFDIKERPAMKIDTGEIAESKWLSAQALHQEFLDGEILAVPPTLRVIETLASGAIKEVDLNLDYDPEKDIPVLEPVGGLLQAMPLSNTLPPAVRTNCFIVGDNEKRIAIDPSPKDEVERSRLVDFLKKQALTGILITHHHGDHNEFSESIARELDLPMLMSKTTHELLERYRGENFFDGIEIQLIGDGDHVVDWKSSPVRVMETPGHDEGQICLYPENNKWFIAGDLFQGIGSVVVGGEHGDMAKYFDSLERVIALAPDRVFPSHGIGLGGVEIIKKNLEHRKLREQQVKELLEQNKSNQEILETLYFDIPKKLWPYAMANIEAHIAKLKG